MDLDAAAGRDDAQVQQDKQLLDGLEKRIVKLLSSGENDVHKTDFAEWVWEDSGGTRAAQDFYDKSSYLGSELIKRMKGAIVKRTIRIVNLRFRRDGSLYMEIEAYAKK